MNIFQKPDYDYLIIKSNYLFLCMSGIIIFDKNLGGTSVTNAIEVVLAQIKKEMDPLLSWPPLIIIYRDSEKNFSSVQLGNKGGFLGFRHCHPDPAKILQLATEDAIENRRSIVDLIQSDRELFIRYSLDNIREYTK